MKHFAPKLSAALIAVSIIFPVILNSQTVPQKPAFKKETVPYTADERSAVVRSRHGELYTPTIGKPGSWPGIVLVHGFLGITPLIRSEAETLASHGYLVLMVNLYEDTIPTKEEERGTLWATLDHRSALTTCEGALSFLQKWSSDPENMGAVGWGDGGSLVLDMAAEERNLKAVVDFGGDSNLPPETFHRLAPHILVQTQMVPNEALALKFLDAHMKSKSK